MNVLSRKEEKCRHRGRNGDKKVHNRRNRKGGTTGKV